MSTCPHLFRSHPNLSDEVNRNIVQSEIEGGVFLNDLPPATVLEIQTQHHCYQLVLLDDKSVLISGHPEFCPEPIKVAIAGSTWGGSMLKRRFSMEPPQVEPAMATGIGSGQYWGCPEISALLSLRRTTR